MDEPVPGGPHGGAPKCGGTNRQGRPCGNPAGYKTDHAGSGNCHFHGGSSPNGRVHAAEQRIEDEARRALYQYDAAPCADPIEALQRLAGRALAWERAIGDAVNRLQEQIRYEDVNSAEQLRAEVAVMERAMDRCGRFLVDIAKLNIEERLATVTEKQARMAMDALAAAMRDMGMSLEQQREARTLVARRLRAVA